MYKGRGGSRNFTIGQKVGRLKLPSHPASDGNELGNIYRCSSLINKRSQFHTVTDLLGTDTTSTYT